MILRFFKYFYRIIEKCLNICYNGQGGYDMTDYKVPDSNEKIYIEKNKMNSAFDMPALHSHKCNELYFLLSGQRRYFIGHSIYDVSPGNIVIIPGYELHRTAALNSRASERYMVYFYDLPVS